MIQACLFVLSVSLLLCFIEPSRLNLNFQEVTKLLKTADQEYGYSEVRPGAHLFWWLHYAAGERAGAADKPLVLWVQGGPSLPASGIGNFLEFGPLDTRLQKRKHSWVKKRNVLFVDSPIGTGFSYAEKEDLLCRTDKEIAADLAEFVKQFLEKHPEFKSTPFHIFSQSYGAKIALHLAARLHREKLKNRIEVNLKTVALGSAWVSPRESAKAMPGLLYHTGYVDSVQYETMQQEVDGIMKLLDNKLYKQAQAKRSELIDNYTTAGDVNIYNILKTSYVEELLILPKLMNYVVRPVLGPIIPEHVEWGIVNDTVLHALQANIMKPATHIVENLLEQTDLNIVVYNGNMDLATPLTGAENWVNKLKWHGAEEFKQSKRIPLEGFLNGYVKRHSRLHLWSILNAGHWIPNDNPAAMEQLLGYFVDFPQTETSTLQPSATADTPEDETTTESYVEPAVDDDNIQGDTAFVSMTTEVLEEDTNNTETTEINGDTAR